MSLHFQLNNHCLEAKVERWVSETGGAAEELITELMAAFFEELERTRETLGSRYDDIKRGRVKLAPGKDVIARLRERSAAYRGR
jgi:hypothetical protein